MAAATPAEILAIHRKVGKLRKYSDRIVGVGPFGIGLDGVLAWVPGVGTAYSVGSASWLLVQAVRCKASPATIVKMVGYLGFNTASSAVPIWGYAVDTLFPGILMASGALMKDIEARHPEARPPLKGKARVVADKPSRPAGLKPARGL